MRSLISLLLLLLGATSPLLAHENHEEEEKPSGYTVTVTLPAPSLPKPTPGLLPKGKSFLEVAFAHPHNKLVHFPIVLGLIGGLLLVWSFLSPGALSPARKLILLGAIFALLAYFSGQAQEEGIEAWVEKKGLEPALELHETLGLTTTLSFFAVYLLSHFVHNRLALAALGLLLAALVSVTGFFGGVIAHP